MHLNSKLLFQKYAAGHFSGSISVLEIGSNGHNSIFKKIITDNTIKWHTLDIDDRYIGDISNNDFHINSTDGYNYPIPDNKFDIIFSAQVMEHVEDIWKWMLELKRITKNNGLIITISPISWTFHETPIDCWRIYPHGMKNLMEKCNLDILLNKFESLEKDYIPKSTPVIPGDSTIKLDLSYNKKSKFKLSYNKLLSIIPFTKIIRVPVTVSFDNICICRKTEA